MRDRTDIIRDLQRVECALSPENLCCDGELSKSETNRRYRTLTKERAKLVKELGREPTAEELWGRVDKYMYLEK